jgi:phage terminase large subunit GpA-like protein
MAVRRYEKVYERNEALDCAVYARAALLILGPLREQLGVLVDRLQPKGPTPAPDAPKGVQVPKKPPKRGGWVNRW